MKILLLIDSLGAGGAQRQLAGLAIMLKGLEYDVSVVYYHDLRFYETQLINSGVPYLFLSKAKRASTRIWYISRYIRKVNPDWVISFLETPSIYACLTKIITRGFRLIVSERNTTQHTGLKEKIRFLLFRNADYVVPNSFAQAEYINKTFPELTRKVVTIPNFVDLNYFIPPAERQRKEVPEIVIAATIRASKNTLGFIDVVAKLKKKGYKFHISWFGKNSAYLNYFNQCQQKIMSLNLQDSFELKDKTTQILDCYHGADYFCLPSFYEGTPNVICEAMACGLPVACSDVCDNSRYVYEGKNGFLFNPIETDTIVSAFESLFALTDEDYLSFCKASRQIAEQKLSKEAFINAYLKLIKL
jgi:glycosyltransferase involved in cell wall biosynthesis